MSSGRDAERRAHERIRAALPREYRLYPNVEWVGPSSAHGRPHDGEADLVIAHERGLLVLEVKAGEPSKHADGTWWISDRELSRSPFSQAMESKHALLRKLTDLPGWPHRDAPRAGHGVVLPDADLASLPRGHVLLGPEAPIDIIVDATTLETPEATRSAIDRLYRYWAGERGEGTPPGLDGMRVIEELLGAEHQLHRLVRGRIEDDRPALLEATRDQRRIVDQHRRSRRLEIVGPAGSGKSMLAAAKARRLAREGYRTLLVCFNQRLASELIRDLADATGSGEAPAKSPAPDAATKAPAASAPTTASATATAAPGGLVVSTFHRLCELLGTQAGTLPPKPAAPIPQWWWDEALPGGLEGAVGSKGFEPFHAVVVDEGQDFALPWLRLLERMLHDPDEDILWVFHDPGQAVVRDDVVGELGLDRVELFENLRNPVPIAELSDRFYVGGESVAAYRHDDGEGEGGGGGGRARHRIVEAEPGAPTLEALRKELHRLVVDEKVAPFRIAVLSGVSATESAVWHQRKFGNEPLVNAAIDDAGRSLGLAPEDLPEEPDEVLFETIRRFKGLERDVVVLVELSADAHRLDQLLYTGLTRATTHLTVIAPPALAERLRVARR